MIQLVITACLIGSPLQCQEHRQNFDGPLLTCMTSGGFDAYAWALVHPKWRLARWRCGVVERRA